MESADGWVEYLHELLSGHFYGRQDFKFYKYGDGRFDAETKKAVEQYQRDKGFTGNDVDGVVGDKTWSALQGHETLANTGTDGDDPGTYVDHGKHLRFPPDIMNYADGSDEQLSFRVVIVGDQDVDREEVRPFLHVEGPNGTTEPTDLFHGIGYHGPGGWFDVIWNKPTNAGPAGRYKAIVQLPMEYGGDTAIFEFNREATN
jgi:hypothetical protein